MDDLIFFEKCSEFDDFYKIHTNELKDRRTQAERPRRFFPGDIIFLQHRHVDDAPRSKEAEHGKVNVGTTGYYNPAVAPIGACNSHFMGKYNIYEGELIEVSSSHVMSEFQHSCSESKPKGGKNETLSNVV